MNKIKLQKRYIPFTVLLISIFSISSTIQLKIGMLVDNIFIWWLVQGMILFLFFRSNKYFFDKSQISSMKLVKWYLLWNIISIFRGVFIADSYWEWKALIGNSFAMMIPIVAYAATNTALIRDILKFYLKFALPLFIIFIFLITKDGYGYYLVPISFLALFLPVIKSPWKLIVLAICLLVIFADYGARSNVIKFGIPILLSSIYYFRFIVSNLFLELLRKLLFIAPLLLFILALSGIFNVFNMGDYVKDSYIDIKKDDKGQIVEENLTADTRTILYVEVLQTAVKYNSWFIGRSPARGNETEWFAELAEITGRKERPSNEVAILNIFTWTGIVGIVIYLLIFYKASYLAVNKSNNVFSKILGLFISFRWVYAWVEDINVFSLTYFFLWLMIGLCFSKSFRRMNNNEVVLWVRGIFEKRKSKIKRTYFTQ